MNKTDGMKYFKMVDAGLDVSPLVNALHNNPMLWDAMNLRTTHPMTPHKQASDIVIRFNKLTDDPLDVIDDNDCYWYPATSMLPVLPYIYHLQSLVMGDRIGRSVITRLHPNKMIEPHIDQGSPVSYYQRFHLCLQNVIGSKFIIGDESFEPIAGDLFIVANQIPHWVDNASDTDRLTLIIDIHTPMFQDVKATL